MPALMSNVIAAGSLTAADRLKIELSQSVRSSGLNPQNAFLLLATLLEQEFRDGCDTATAKRFAAFVKAKQPHGMGLEPRQLLRIVSVLQHPHEHGDKALRVRMDWMRERVRQLVDAAEPPQTDGLEALRHAWKLATDIERRAFLADSDVRFMIWHRHAFG